MSSAGSWSLVADNSIAFVSPVVPNSAPGQSAVAEVFGREYGAGPVDGHWRLLPLEFWFFNLHITKDRAAIMATATPVPIAMPTAAPTGKVPAELVLALVVEIPCEVVDSPGETVDFADRAVDSAGGVIVSTGDVVIVEDGAVSVATMSEGR
jgi:hypothetical protein